MNLKEFVKERDAVLLSLDKERIETYFEKRGLPMPKDERVFWACVHKCIVHMNSAPAEQKYDSMLWLTKNGFTLDIL